MESKFNHLPTQPMSLLITNAYLILCYTHETCSSFLNIFENTLAGKGTGSPTNQDQDQDLLRAILVFASSGLDSMIKQLIRDSLGEVINRDQGAEAIFRGHVERKIKKGEQINSSILTNALLSSNPKQIFMQEVVRELTSSSLQSKDELLKIASYFNIPSSNLTTNFNLLKEIFDVRNQIIHEIDINFNYSKHRRQRSQTVMLNYTNEIFRIAEIFLKEVESKVENTASPNKAVSDFDTAST